MFYSIDKFYLKNNLLDSTFLVSLQTFREILFNELSQKLLDALIGEIRKYREKEDVNWEIIHKTIESFIYVGFGNDVKIKKVGDLFQWDGQKNLSVYDKLFETIFIEKTKEYYTIKCKDWLLLMNCPDFINITLKTIKMEEKIAQENMDMTTLIKLKQTLHDVLIEKEAQNVINKDFTGVKDMLKSKKLDQLTKMYSLYSKVDSTLKYIFLEMGTYIEGRGMAVIEDEELLKDPVKFTEQLLDLKKEMDEIVARCFKGNPKFNQTRDRSFFNLMNKFVQTPQHMAEY